MLNVASNSHSQLPAPYRFAATWGSHEGSLLLWTLMLGLWTAGVTWFTRPLPAEMVARVLGVMGAISTGFLLFMLLTSNPFLRLVPAPSDGLDLNPLLQDLAMVLHPPLLYMGYVGFSVAFAFAISALLGGRLDAAWARWSRPWTTLAWMFLTCGIALGSFWAYYELGWGGWWFWDPVENASFMPWLARHGPDSFAGRHRQARILQELDGPARDRHVLAEPAGSVPRAIRRADVGARLRDGSEARRVSSVLPRDRHRRLASSLRLASRGEQDRAAGST